MHMNADLHECQQENREFPRTRYFEDLNQLHRQGGNGRLLQIGPRQREREKYKRDMARE